MKTSYLTNLLKKLLKIVFCKNRSAILETFIIHDPALDGEVLDYAIGPFSELYSTLIVDIETDSNDHLEIIMDHIS